MKAGILMKGEKTAGRRLQPGPRMPDNASAGRGSNPGGGASRPHGTSERIRGGEAVQPPKPGPEGAGEVKIPLRKKTKKK